MRLPGFLRRAAAEPEQRDAGSFALMGGGFYGSAAGPLATPRAAESISTVFACVQVIAASLASLPAAIFTRTPEGRTENTTHPLARLISTGPNDYQDWPDFVEWCAASVLLRGNALVEIVTDGRGAVTMLRPIPWMHVSPQLLPSGRIAYDVTSYLGMYGMPVSGGGGTGLPRRLLADEVIHIRDRSDDGLIGRSRLSRAAEVIGSALAVNEFSASVMRNSANPSGAIESAGKLAAESRERLRLDYEQKFSGPSNAAKILILEQGLSWKSISMSPEDAQTLETRKFSVEELARLFGTPPAMIGDWSRSTFTNAETAGRWFASMTLLPWIKKIESAFQRSIFGGSSSFLELDLSGLTRGDPAQRWASYAIAVQNRILTANEIRSIEGWNARPGGDEFAPIPGAPETGAAAATGGTDPGDAAGADAGGA